MKRLALCVVALLVIGVMSAQAAPSYRFTELGLIGSRSGALGLNDLGQVVGWAQMSDSLTQAVRWDATIGGMTPTNLGTNWWDCNTVAQDINNSGQVAGYVSTQWNSGGVRWNGNTPTILNGLGGMHAIASGINDSGQVVGSSETLGGLTTHATRWDGTRPTDLGPFGPYWGEMNYAEDINDSGQVVGSYRGYLSGQSHAVRWDPFLGGMTPTDLGTLGGSNSIAYGINASGQVAGWSQTSGWADRAVRWDITGGITDLGTLGGDYSYAYGINASGQVVGRANKSLHSPNRAAVWIGDTGFDLNDCLIAGGEGWDLWLAMDINTSGQIVGYGNAPDGSLRGFLLTPTPELSTWMLLACSGLVGLVLKRRRKARTT